MNIKNSVNYGFKVKLYPTKEQEKKIIAFMNARIASWNYGLEVQNGRLEKGEKLINLSELKDMFKKAMETEERYQWIIEEGVPFHLFHFSLRDVNTAYNRYLKKISKRPNFKSVKQRKKSFVQRNDMKQVHKDKIQINKIGRIECDQHQLRRFAHLEGKKVIPTISYDGLDFYYSVSIEKEITPLEVEKTEPLGIDLGIRDLLHMSDGTVVKGVEGDISHLIRRRELLSKRLGRLYKDTDKNDKSQNLKKLEEGLLKVNKKISNYLESHIYQEVSKIINRNPEYIVLEDLKVSSMVKNKNLSYSLNQSKFRFIRDQIEYKCGIHGIPLYLAPSKYPSTKTCSRCGERNDPKTSKIYKCDKCELEIDRDLNASLNLKNYPIKEGLV